jgi:benzoyl-CoA 2,3-epoxidase subunit B
MRLRDDYVADCQGGVDRWNKAIEKAGIEVRAQAAARGVPPHIGEFSRRARDPTASSLSGEWDEARDKWLPSKADGDFIESLMKPESSPASIAGWIAPPKVGIDNKPGDFEYVKIRLLPCYQRQPVPEKLSLCETSISH